MDLKMGPVFSQGDGKGLYIIDDNYDYDYSKLTEPYFLLIQPDKNQPIFQQNFPSNFQDYFLKPLDFTFIKKKLLLWQKKSSMESNRNKKLLMVPLEKLEYHKNQWKANNILKVESNDDYLMAILINWLKIQWDIQQDLNNLLNDEKPLKIMDLNETESCFLVHYLVYNYLTSPVYITGAYIQVATITNNTINVYSNIPLIKISNDTIDIEFKGDDLYIVTIGFDW
jgi:hypothetical protein